MGRPWYKVKTPEQREDGTWKLVVGRRGMAERSAKRMLREDSGLIDNVTTDRRGRRQHSTRRMNGIVGHRGVNEIE